MKTSCSARGFSLIELMIGVAIVAILAAVAVPSYTSFIRKGTVKTAESDLIAASLNLENYFRRKLAYPQNNRADTAALKDDIPGWSPASKADAFIFKYDVTANSNYVLTAVGQGSLDGCSATITLTFSTGAKVCAVGSSCKAGDWSC